MRTALLALCLLALGTGGCASARSRAMTIDAIDQPWWGGERVSATNICSKQLPFADGSETWVQWKSRGGGSVRSPWLVREVDRFVDREGLGRVTFRAPRPPSPFGQWYGHEAGDAPPDTVADFAWCAVGVTPIVLVAVEHRVSYAETDQSLTTPFAVAGPWPAALFGYGLMSGGRVPRSEEVIWCSPSERIAPTLARRAPGDQRIIELPDSILRLRARDGMWEVFEARARSRSEPAFRPTEPLDLHGEAPLLVTSSGAASATASRGVATANAAVDASGALGRWAFGSRAFRLELSLDSDGTGECAYAYRFLPTVHRWTITEWTLDAGGRIRLECRSAEDPRATARWIGVLRRDSIELDLCDDQEPGGRRPHRTVRLERP